MAPQPLALGVHFESRDRLSHYILDRNDDHICASATWTGHAHSLLQDELRDTEHRRMSGSTLRVHPNALLSLERLRQTAVLITAAFLETFHLAVSASKGSAMGSPRTKFPAATPKSLCLACCQYSGTQQAARQLRHRTDCSQ